MISYVHDSESGIDYVKPIRIAYLIVQNKITISNEDINILHSQFTRMRVRIRDKRGKNFHLHTVGYDLIVIYIK